MDDIEQRLSEIEARAAGNFTARVDLQYMDNGFVETIERLQAELAASRERERRLRAAVEAALYFDVYGTQKCGVCHRQADDHAADCQRQAALRGGE